MSFHFPKEQDNPFIPDGLTMGEADSGFLFGTSLRAEGTRSSISGALSRWLEQEAYEETDKSSPLSAKTATELYGIEGQLSFSSPVKASVAKLLNRRKTEELQFDRILATADGFGQRAAVFSGALVSSLVDPMTLTASAIPILGQARWAQLIGKYGVVGGRIVGGAIEGGVGNLLIEPLILTQAQRDQMNYGPVDSLINMGMGVLIGGGIGLVAGRYNRWVSAVRQRAHLEALRVSVNQLASGKNVEVDPIIRGSAKPENLGKAIDLDDGFAPPVEHVELEGESISITNPVPPHFTEGQLTPSKGWESKIVDVKDVMIGDYISIEYADGPFVQGVVTNAEDGQISYEVINSNAEEFKVGEEFVHNSAVAQLGAELAVHTPIDGYFQSMSPDDIAPTQLVGDESPPMGDVDTDQLELFTLARHQKALDIEDLTDPTPVSSDFYKGSHPGGFVTEKGSDKTYYAKYPADVEQARQEYVAYTFYKLAGLSVPEVRPIFRDGQLVGVASESLEQLSFDVPQSAGDLYGALIEMRKAHPESFEEFMEGIIIDAWLGNRDFAAPGNIIIVVDDMIGSNGPATGIYRIDYGGALDYRAQGAKKHLDEGLESKVVELETFLDPDFPAGQILGLGGKTFGSRKGQLASGIDRLAKISDDDILSVVYSVGLDQETAVRLSSTLIGRRDELISSLKNIKEPSVEAFNESFTNGASNKFLKRSAHFHQVISKNAQYHLGAYKGIAYDDLNTYLRWGPGGKPGSPHGPMSASKISSVQQAIKGLDEATKAFTFQKTTYLWRSGVPFKAFGLENDMVLDEVAKKLLTGGPNILHDKGFMSTTIDRDFAVKQWGHPKQLTIRLQVPPGYTAAIPGSIHLEKGEANQVLDSEFEYILPRNTKMVPTGVFMAPDGGGKIIVNMKVVPHENVKLITSTQAIEVAKKYKHMATLGADDEGIPEEVVYSLKQSTQVEEGEGVITAINRETDEIMSTLKEQPDITEDQLSHIVEEHGIMETHAKAMAKGAQAAYPCVMRSVNV